MIALHGESGGLAVVVENNKALLYRASLAGQGGTDQPTKAIQQHQPVRRCRRIFDSEACLFSLLVSSSFFVGPFFYSLFSFESCDYYCLILLCLVSTLLHLSGTWEEGKRMAPRNY